MANNRMFLVHDLTGRRYTLAKYFPSTGWTTRVEPEIFNEWLSDCVALSSLSPSKETKLSIGPTCFRLEFEELP